jgi:Zn-dependent protease with chaperone function
MGFAVRKPSASPAAGWALSPAWPLLGLYVFLAAAVGCVGAAAGELFFHGYGPLSNSFAGAQNRCLLRFPMASHIQELDRCLAGAYRSQGWFVLGSAGAMLVITAGLILVVPWLDRWRLARAPRFADIRGETTPVTARFRSLCGEAGLAGRRCPDLLVAGVPEAFTTVLPGGRPLVVLPVKVALGCDDPRRFDPVVLHELAHVRVRDVSLASAVRGISWITVPVVALASLPQFLAGWQGQVQGASLVQAALFVLAAILVAAALLRFREIAADRQAALWLGSPGALSDLLDTAGGRAGAGMRSSGRWWLRPLARHPSLGARRTALRLPSGPRGVGLAYGFAVGAVAAMAMDVCFFLAGSLDQPAAVWLPVRVWAAAGGVLLGLGLAPALLRDAERARQAGTAAVRWDAAAGTGLGLLLGSIVPPGTAASAVISVVVGAGFRGVTTAVILAFTGAGLTVLIAGLASLAAERFPRQPAWLTACLAITISGWAAGALLPVFLLPSAGFDLHSLAFTLGGNPWRPLLLLYPATVILLVARTRPAHPAAGMGSAPDRRPGPAAAARYWGRRAPAILSPAITPVCAAASAVALFLWHTPLDRSWSVDLFSRWVEEEWRVCAFAGWVVLVILVLAKGIPGLARACVSAWSATVLAAVGTVIYGTITGWPGSSFVRLARDLAITPSVWLFYLAVPTSLLALMPARRLAMPKQRWLLPAGASAGAAASVILVFTTAIPGLTGPAESTASSSYCGSPAGIPAESSPSAAATADRVMTYKAAQTVVAGVCTALPAGWISGASSVPTERVTVRPAGCTPLSAEVYLSVLYDPQTWALGQYQLAPRTIDGSETLTVRVNSYAQPVPPSPFAAADRDLARCHRYIASGPGGALVWTAHRFSMPGVSAGAWGITFSAHLSSKGLTAGETTTQVIMKIGRDFIIINQRTITVGIQPPPAYAVIAAAVGAVESSFSETPLSPAQACYALRADRNRLAHELAGADNGFNSAQLNDVKIYGETVAQLAKRINQSRSGARLAPAFMQVGAADRAAGAAPESSAKSIAAFNDTIKANAAVRKDCSAIGAWP